MAILDSSQYCSIILYGADQLAFGPPRFYTNPSLQPEHALNVNLIGFLEHYTHSELQFYRMLEDHAASATHILKMLH